MRRVVAPSLLAATALLVPVSLALGVAANRRGLNLPADRESMLVLELIVAAAAVLYAVVGILVVRRQPGNAIGWIFLGAAPLFVLVGAAYGYADLSLYGGESWPLDTWAAWTTNWLFGVPVFLAPVFVAQLFPDGRPVSNGWRWVLWATVASAGLTVVLGALRAAPLDPYPDVESPAALPGAAGELFADAWDAGGVVVQPLVFLAALGSLVARFRRSRGVERQQLKWLAFSGVVLTACFLGASVAGSGLVSDVFFVVGITALVGMPVTVAVAILRYRLYEIDRLISRTLVYGSVTVILGAAYAGLVLGGQAVFSSFAGGSNLAIAVSTLVVAALFLPVRGRIQRVVDRRFYRRRYDAQRTLEAFGGRLRDEVDLPTLSADLRDVVDETMQPAHVSLWLREETSR